MPNRLANETSPYLLQHQDNPVDWYPWSPEALGRARAEDKPILLSVGYSACHWCHVMEHESFEDSETARLMNESFVNIKVDREERPDIDGIYMTAVQQMTGHGGWPLTAFLTPEGVPFYGGTYFPPEPRHGMPSFRQILQGVSEAYTQRRDQVERSAAELHDLLRRSSALRAPRSVIDTSVLDRAYHSIAAGFDARHGGFGSAPKFPQPLVLEFLLRHWKRTGSDEALGMTDLTLDCMAAGGMYDQIGGGFHRYSVDAHWLVPHFEKMLYDNALLARVYLHAYQATGKPEYRRVVEEIFRYVQREMRSREGGFFSAQDADSEGEEGRFYVWTPEEVDALLGSREGPLFRQFYDITERGNWQGDPHRPRPEPTSIPHMDRSVEQAATEFGITPERLEEVLHRGREVLYEARAQRVWPGRDDKILTAWNAMVLHAFAEAARVLDQPEYQEVAIANAEFLLRELRPGGRVLRTWRNGVAKIDAFLEDHALLADALLALYETTFDPRWVREARSLADTVLERFWDEGAGVFYDTAAGGEELVIRPRNLYDNPTSSGTSAAVMMLLRLTALTGDSRYERVAVRALEGMGGLLTKIPSAFGYLLSALDFHLATPREVAIVGDPEADDTRALVRVVNDRYLPNTVIALRTPHAAPSGDTTELLPLLEGREMVEGRAAAYVCERFACRRPVTEPGELEKEVEGR